MSEEEYVRLRDECIRTYGELFKDSLVFDACKVDKTTRVRLQQDAVYVRETKASKARLFCDQLSTLNSVISGAYVGEKQTDQSGNVLKALELKNKLLFDDLDVNRDESNALNVTFVAMDRAAFEDAATVEVVEGSSDATLGADFGDSDSDESFESRMKSQVAKKMKEGREMRNGGNGTSS